MISLTKSFGLTGSKKIDVRVRSDLHNIVKNMESSITGIKKLPELESKEGEENG